MKFSLNLTSKIVLLLTLCLVLLLVLVGSLIEAMVVISAVALIMIMADMIVPTVNISKNTKKSSMHSTDKVQQHLQTILDSVITGVLVIDSETHIIVDANPTACEIIGAPKEDIVGKVCHNHVCMSDLGQCPITDLGQTIDKSERSMLKADGTKALIIKNVVPTEIDGRQYLIESFIDISERKQMEEALERSNAELTLTVNKLENLNSELRELAYIASHDLREPLRKILSFVTFLDASLKDKLSAEDRENLDFVIEGTNQMQHMVSAIRDYSNVVTEQKLHEEANLNVIVRQLKQFDFSEVLEETGAEIQIPESLPTIKCNAGQIYQVMFNMISNALKYHKKDIRPQVVIRSKAQEDGMVRIEVSDNGVGIRQDQFKDIFVMFKRLHAHQEYADRGVGLAVCKKIIEKHGGNIGVSSSYGEGSTFWFTVPVNQTIEERDAVTLNK